MKIFFSLLFFLLPISFVNAEVPERVVQESLVDIKHIQNPEEKHFFYGDLRSFPHTFQIDAEEALDLFVEVRVPDIENVSTNVNAIIIKEKSIGGVEEVARLRSDEAAWEKVKEPFDGNSYLIGPKFESGVEGGVYRVEVNTPDNIEKYVLIIGVYDSTEDVGYFSKVKRIIDTKVFFGKSKFRAIESPVIYKPIFFLVFLSLILYLMYRRKNKTPV